jgi:hypothetical protein
VGRNLESLVTLPKAIPILRSMKTMDLDSLKCRDSPIYHYQVGIERKEVDLFVKQHANMVNSDDLREAFVSCC